jgi:hypothetical protein
MFAALCKNVLLKVDNVLANIRTQKFSFQPSTKKTHSPQHWIQCRVRLTKSAEEDATFCLVKDGTFLPLFV